MSQMCLQRQILIFFASSLAVISSNIAKAKKNDFGGVPTGASVGHCPLPLLLILAPLLYMPPPLWKIS